MDLDASWDISAAQYVELYRFGLLAKKWRAARRRTVANFIRSLKEDRDLYSMFFIPGRGIHADRLDRELKEALDLA